MSIYASINGIDEDEPCGAPWIYQGSHILPTVDGPRGGNIHLALIPSHITRDGRDDQPEDDIPWPWLRFGVDADEDAVLINPAQARHLADQLTAWADQADPPSGTGPEGRDAATDSALDELYGERARLAAEVQQLRRDCDHRDTIISRLEAGLAADHATIDRVRALAARWSGTYPPLGTSISRWWDTRVGELLTALDTTSSVHYYLSTGCLHGDHGYCQSETGAAGAKIPAVCKFCRAPCTCRCHQRVENQTADTTTEG